MTVYLSMCVQGSIIPGVYFIDTIKWYAKMTCSLYKLSKWICLHQVLQMMHNYVCKSRIMPYKNTVIRLLDLHVHVITLC